MPQTPAPTRASSSAQVPAAIAAASIWFQASASWGPFNGHVHGGGLLVTLMEPESEFEDIVRRYWRLVVREAARILHDPASADDVAQEVFVALWRRGALPATSDHMRNWLCRTARHRSLSLLRRAALPIVEGVSPDFLPAEIAEDRESWSGQLTGAISSLPGHYVDAVRLRYLAGMDIADVAAVLGVPLETARTRVRRGVERLKRELAPPPQLGRDFSEPKRNNKARRR